MSPTKPSTARYCSLQLQRERLLNNVSIGVRPTNWLGLLTDLEHLLLLESQSDEVVQHWARTARDSATLARTGFDKALQARAEQRARISFNETFPPSVDLPSGALDMDDVQEAQSIEELRGEVQR